MKPHDRHETWIHALFIQIFILCLILGAIGWVLISAL